MSDGQTNTNSADVSNTLPSGAPAGCEAVTDHDAAPAARAAELARSPGQSPRGTGDTTREPVAWAALREDGDIAWVGYTPEGAADGACGRQIVPLFRQPQPTLTDAEREALERAAQWMVQLAKDRGEIHSAGYFVDDAATLRGLLARLGGGE